MADFPNTTPAPIVRISPARTFRSVSVQVTVSHRDLIERLRRIPPNEVDPRLQADSEDLETRAEILRCHLLAMKDYVDEYLADTAGMSWSVHVDRKWIEDCWRDLIQDIVGPIDIASETVWQETNYCPA